MWLRYFLGEMLKGELAERAEKGFSNATSAEKNDDHDDHDGGDKQQKEVPAHCDVGVVMALGIEAQGLTDRLSQTVSTRGKDFTVRFGRLGEQQIAVVESGAGCRRAAAGTEALLAGHQPDWIVSAGFAGGLHESLNKGDILLADSLADQQGHQLSIDVHATPGAGLHIGRLLTVDRVLFSPEEKREYGQQYDALAVDMETTAVAEVCRRHNRRLIAVRVISDACDDRLPPEVENLLKQSTLASKLGAAAGSLWRRPSSVKDMWGLREAGIESSERLGKFLVEIIPSLTPAPRE